MLDFFKQPRRLSGGAGPAFDSDLQMPDCRGQVTTASAKRELREASRTLLEAISQTRSVVSV